MPVINPTAVVPLNAYPRPITLHDFRGQFPRLGSSDTYLGRLFGTYFDEGYSPYKSLQTQRYYNQDALNTAGNFAANLLMDVIAEGGFRLAAGLTGLVASPATLVSDLTFGEIMENNPLNMAANALQELSSKWAPLFVPEGFEDRTLLQQLASPTDYIIHNAEAVSYLASMFVGAGFVNKLATSAISGLAMQGVKIPTKAGLAGTTLLSDMALSSAEATVEAREPYRKFMQMAEQAQTEEERERYRQLASNAYANVFTANLATLALTNLTFLRTLSPLMKSAYKGGLGNVADNVFGLELAEEGLVKLPKYNSVERWFFDKGYAPGVLSRSFLREAAVNAFEEYAQYSYQKVAEEATRPLNFLQFFTESVADMYNESDFRDQQRLKETFLGGLLGSVSVAGASALGIGPYQEATKFAADREATLKQLNDAYKSFSEGFTDLRKADLFKRDSATATEFEAVQTPEGYFLVEKPKNQNLPSEEPKREQISKEEYDRIVALTPKGQTPTVKRAGELILDEQGRPQLDPGKVAAFLAAHVDMQEAWQDLNAAVLSEQDPKIVRYFAKKMLVPLIHAAYNSGTGNILVEKLRGLKALTDPTLKQEELGEYVEDLISFGDRMVEKFNEVQAYVNPLYYSDDKEFREIRSTAFNLAAKITLFKELTDSLKNVDLEIGDEQKRGVIARAKEKAKELLDSAFKKFGIKRLEQTQEEQETEKTETDKQEKPTKLLKEQLKEADKLAQTIATREFAKKTLERLEDLYGRLLDPRTARQALNEIKNEKIVRGSAIPTPNLTKEEYALVKKENIRRRQKASAVKKASASNKARVLLRYLREHTVEEIVENFEDVADLAHRVASAGIGLTAEEVQEIISKLEQTQQHLQRRTQTEAVEGPLARLKERVPQLFSDPQIQQEVTDLITSADSGGEALENFLFMYEEAFPEEYDNVRQTLIEAIRTREANSSLENQINEIIELFRQMPASTEAAFPLDEEEAEREFFKEITDAVKDAFGKAVESEDEDFVDLARASYELNLLDKLIEYEKDSPYVKYLKEARELAEKAVKLAKTNLAKKEQADLSVALTKMAALVHFVSTNPDINQEVKDAILRAAEVSPIFGYYIALDFLSDLGTDPQIIVQASGIGDKVYSGTEFLATELLYQVEKVLGISRSFPNEVTEISAFFRELKFSQLLQYVEEKYGKEAAKKVEATIQEAEARAALLDFAILLSKKPKELKLATIIRDITADILAKREQGPVKVLSVAQLSAILELAITAYSSGEHQPFDDVAAVKAPAGAGKTSVVIPGVINTLGLTPSQVVALGSTAGSTTLVQQEVPSSHKDINSVEQLINLLNEGTLPSEVKLILLDEAGHLNKSELHRLTTALAFYNQSKGANVKLFFFYDSMQVGSEGTSARIELDQFIEAFGQSVDLAAARQGKAQDTRQMPYGVVNIHRMQRTRPLNVMFRANSLEIVTLADPFARAVVSPESFPDSFTTTANFDPNSNILNDAPYGTAVVRSTTSLVSLAAQASKLAPSRSRLIIVDSDERKQELNIALAKEGVQNFQVLRLDETRGMSADEVYVDTLSETKDKRLVAQKYYLAITRARDFVAVLSQTPTNHTVDTSLKEKTEATKEATITGEGRLNILNETVDRLVKAGLASAISKDKKEPDKDDGDADDGEDSDDSGPRDFVFKHPTSELFALTEAAEVPIQDAPVGVIVTKEEDGRELARVVIPDKFSNLPDRYTTIAILAEDEIIPFLRAAGLGAKADYKLIPKAEYSAVKNTDPSGKVVIHIPNGKPLQTPLKVSRLAKPLRFKYGATSVALSQSDYNAIFRTVISPFYANHSQEALEEVVASASDYMEVKIYSSESQLEKDFGTLPPDKRPRKFVPYLIIRDVPSPTGGTIKPLFIRLKSKPAGTEHTKHIVHLIHKLEEFENLLRLIEKNLPEAYQGIRFGTANKDGFHLAHALVVGLAKAKKDGKTKVIMVEPSKRKGILGKYVDIDLSTLDENSRRQLLDLASEVAYLVHGNYGEEGFKGGGPAQTEFDALARVNLFATTTKGKNILLTDFERVGKGRDFVSTGLSLLGPIKFYEGSVPYVKKINQALKDRLVQYAKSLQERGLTNSARYHLVLQMISAVDDKFSYLQYYDTETLRELFIESASEGIYSEVSEGFALRAPIPKGMTAKVTEVVEGAFETDFDTVLPTVVRVYAKEDAAEEEQKRRPKEKSVFEIKKIISRSSSAEEALSVIVGTFTEEDAQLLTEFTSLMEVNSLEEAVNKYFQNTRESIIRQKPRKESLVRLIKSLMSRPLDNRVRFALSSSSSAVEVGEKAGTYAARDFTRAALLSIALGINPNNSQEIFEVLDIAREYPDPFIVSSLLTALIEKVNLSVDQFIENFNLAYAEYAAALAENGIVIDQSAATSVFEAVLKMEAVVKASSEYRAKERAGEIKRVDITSEEGEPTGEQDEFKQETDISNILGEEDTTFLVGLLNEYYEAVSSGTVDAFYGKYESELELRFGVKSIEELVEAMTAIEQRLNEKPFLAKDLPEEEFDMTESEAIAYFEAHVPLTAKKLIAKLFSRKTNSEVVRFVTFNRLQNSKGQKAYGLYKNGIISLMRSEKGFVSKRVLRHEMFHKYFWEYLTEEERLKALALAAEKYGETDPDILEEKLADALVEYSKPKSLGARLYDFVRKVLRFFGFTFRTFNTLDELFRLMDAGLLGKVDSASGVEKPMLRIYRDFGGIHNYDFAKEQFLSTFDKVYKGEYDGKVYSFDEAVVKTAGILSKFKSENQEEVRAVRTLLRPKTLSEFLRKYFSTVNLVEAARRLRAEELKEDVLSEVQGAVDRAEELGELDADEVIEFDEDSSSEVSIYSQIIEKEEVNPEEALTARVKQQLGSVYFKRKSDGKFVFIDLSSAYSLLLPILSSVHAQSLSDYVNTLSEKVQTALPKAGKEPTSARAAVAKRIADLRDEWEALKVKLKQTSVYRRVSFRSDIQRATPYVVVSLDRSINAYSISTFKAATTPGVLVIESGERSTDVWISDLAKEMGVSTEELRLAYRFSELTNFFLALHFASASLVPTNPHVGTEQWAYGNYSSNYFEIKTRASRRINEGKIRKGLQDLITRDIQRGLSITYANESNPLTMERLKNALAGLVNKRTDVLSAEEDGALKELFVSHLGVPASVYKELTSSQKKTVGRTAYYALRSLLTKVKELIESADDPIFKLNSAKELVMDEGSLIGEISDIVNQLANFSESHAYINAQGRVAYGFTMGSRQTEALQLIVSQDTDGIDKVRNHKLITKNPLLKYNVFTEKGPARLMGGFFKHDSLKGTGGGVTTLLREKSTKAVRRIINHFVLDMFYQSKGYYYGQTLPTPSNRKTVYGVKVAFLTWEEAEKALRVILDYQKNKRPDNIDEPTYRRRRQEYIFAGIPKGTKTSSLSVDDAVKMVIEHIKAKSEELVEKYFSGERPLVPTEPRKVHYMARRMGLYAKGETTIQDLQDELKALYIARAAKEKTKEKREEIKAKVSEVMARLMPLIYVNYAVNMYGLSEWLYGDPAFFSSKEDLTKRIQIATSPGQRPIVDEEFGLKPTMKVAVFEDVPVKIGEEVELAQGFEDQSADRTDAQGYLLPETFSDFSKAMPDAASPDVVMKPMYYGLDPQTGKIVQLKFTTVVITDELAEMFPKLNEIRLLLLEEGVDLLVPKSAMKKGSPAKPLKFDAKGNLLSRREEIKNAVVPIDSRFLRISTNLAGNVDSSTQTPTQLPFVLNPNGLNTAQVQKVFNAAARIIHFGGQNVLRELRLSPKGTPTGKTVRRLTKYLLQLSGRVPGFDSLEHFLPQGSLNFPAIAQRVASLVAVKLSAMSYRVAGSRLVLQSDFGTAVHTDPKTGKKVDKPLSFRTKEGYSEAFLPPVYVEKFDGEAIFIRIPTSGMHSAGVVKPVGSYPTPPGAHGNLSVFHGALVYFHGSDHDGDVIFTLVRERLRENLPIGKLLSHIVGQLVDPNLVFEEGTLLDSSTTVNGQNLFEYFAPVLKRLEEYVERARLALLNSANMPAQRVIQLNKALDEINTAYETVNNLLILASKNDFVQYIMDILADRANDEEILTPITFYPVNATQNVSEGEEDVEPLSGTKIGFEEKVALDYTSLGTAHMWYAISLLNKGQLPKANASLGAILEELLPVGEFNDLDAQLGIQRNVNSGARSVGIAANTIKAFGAALEATPPTKVKLANGEIIEGEEARRVWETAPNSVTVLERELPKVSPKHVVKIDNFAYDGFNLFVVNPQNGESMELFGKPFKTTIVLDTVTNLALDEVKEARLFILGVNPSNASTFFTALSMGIPLNTTSLIFRSPVVTELFERTYIGEGAENVRRSPAYVSRRDFKLKKQVVFTPQVQETLENAFGVNPWDNLSEARLPTDILLIYLSGGLQEKFGQDAEIIKTAVELVLLETVAKLSDIAKRVFVDTRILGILKRLPPSKAAVNALLELIDQHYVFPTGERMATTKQALDASIDDLVRSGELTEQEANRIKKSKPYMNFLEQLQSASVLNAFVRTTNTVERAVPKESSPLVNVSMFRLPQVVEAFKLLIVYSKVLEGVLAIHNPQIETLATEVVRESGIFTLPNKKHEIIYQLQTAIFRALTYGLTLQVGPNWVVDLAVSPEEQYTDPAGSVYSGVEAFVRRFEQDFLTQKIAFTDSALFSALELTSTGRIGMTLDKTGNEELIEKIRADYSAMLVSKDPQKVSFALDLFKYAVLTTGLFYSRTTLSNVFPVALTQAYAKALEERIKKVLPSDNPAMSRVVLEHIKDTVLLSYLRSVKESLQFVSGVVPEPTGSFTNRFGKKEDLHQGFDEKAEGQVVVYYDLKFPKSGDETARFPRYIRRWKSDPHVYAKIYEDDSYAYYRAIGIEGSSTYAPDTINLGNNLDLEKLLNPNLFVIPSTLVTFRGTAAQLLYPKQIPKDTLVYVFEVGASSAQHLRVFRVTRSGKASTGEHYVHSFEDTGEVYSITVGNKFQADFDVASKLKYTSRNQREGYDTAIEALQAKKSKGDGISIISSQEYASLGVGNPLAAEADVVLPLDITNTTSIQQRQAFLERVTETINQIPIGSKLYVSRELLSALASKDLSLALEVAKRLYQRLGWRDRILNRGEEADVSDRLEFYHKVAVIPDYKASPLSLTSTESQSAIGSLKKTIDVSSLDKVNRLEVSLDKFALIYSGSSVPVLQSGTIIDFGPVGTNHLFMYVTEVLDKNVKGYLFDRQVMEILPNQKYPSLDVFESAVSEVFKRNC